METNRLILTDIIKLENKITWISLAKSFVGRWSTIRHILHTLEEGFIIKPSYMDIHLYYALFNVIGQQWNSSHPLEIEVGRYAQIPQEERICLMYHQGMEFGEHYICHCTIFYEIRRRQGFGPQCIVMDYVNQQCSGLLLVEFKRHKEKLLKDYNRTTQAHQQRTMTTFFSQSLPLKLQVN